MTTAVPSGVQAPLLGRLLGGTSWLAIQFLLQIVLSLWAVRLIVEAVGPDRAGDHVGTEEDLLQLPAVHEQDKQHHDDRQDGVVDPAHALRALAG